MTNSKDCQKVVNVRNHSFSMTTILAEGCHENMLKCPKVFPDFIYFSKDHEYKLALI